MFKLDQKLSRIHSGQYKRSDFIIADAKDPDMGPSLAGCGPKRKKDGTSASLPHVRPYTDLGLYSMTFNNDLDHDYDSLDHFADFRADAADNEFKYFLEVFNPNVDCNMDPAIVPHYVNDSIVRCLAGLTKAERPLFLKIPFNGPKALDELASFDPGIVVGVLGGGAGTTRDCFELINQAEKYGARVALFGRKINLAEDPLAMVSFMREVASGNIQPQDAVKAYHASLHKSSLLPIRSLDKDNEITEKVLMSG